MKLETLDQIGVRCGTDKSSRFHSYLHYYHELLSPLRHLPITLLEIGVDGGESIKMWSEFFTHPNSIIYGCDIHDKGGDLGRGKFIHGDATEPNMVHDISQLGPFDVIVEDASHYSDDQKKILELMWPHVRPSGLYIVEDCHCSFTYPWTNKNSESFVEYTMKWIKDIHEHGKDHRAVPTTSDIEEMIIRKSLTVFKKRLVNQPA